MDSNNLKCTDSKLLRNKIGYFILSSRLNKSLTGTELAKLIHVSQQQISRYENGITSISLERLNEILSVLDLEWSDLYHAVLENKQKDTVIVK